MLKKNQRTSTLPTYQFIFHRIIGNLLQNNIHFAYYCNSWELLIALDVALSTLFIPVGDNLRIKFDF